MPIASLHLTNAYHESSGGIRTMYHALLAQAEIEQRSMTLVVPGDTDREEPRGRFTRIVHVRAPRSPVADDRYRVILPHRFLVPGSGLWRILDRVHPDLVEVCDKYSLCYFAGLIRRRRARPTLVGLSCERLDDNLQAYVGGRRTTPVAAAAFLGRAYIGMFDAHVANSDYTAEELRRAMRPPHTRPVHVSPMGIELPSPLHPYVRASIRRKLLDRCGASDGDLLLYAGRLSPEKNVEVLAGVIASLAGRNRPVFLVVAGDGPLRGPLQTRAEAIAPGRTLFVGHITDRAALAQLTGSVDAFIHPNPREPFGIGPLEAMATGTPLIAPGTGGLLSYATAENAWLAGSDPSSLAGAVARCLDDGPGRRARAAHGIETASRFEWSASASRLLRLYDRVHAERVAAYRLPPSRRADRVTACTA
jgi:alpha-1,6-mannosyltransferase